MKIRNKINFSYLLAYVFVFSLVGLVVGIYTTNLMKKNIYSYLHSSSRARAEHIRTFIADQEKTGVILAAASVYRDLLKEPVISSQYSVIKAKIDKRLIRTMQSDPLIYETFILDVNGKVIASSDKSFEGQDRSNDTYFTEAKDKVFFKDVYFSTTINKFIYAIAVPVKDDDGTFLGVSVLRYLPTNLYAIVQNENGLGKTEENFLINKEKFFITPSLFLGDEVVLKQKVETKNANDCFDSKEIEYIKKNGYTGLVQFTGNSQINEAKDYRNVDVVVTHAYIPETGWCLITKVDRADALAFRTTLIIIFLGIFLIAALLYVLIGWLISKKITDSITALLFGTQKIEQGDYSYKTNIKTKDEIGDFSRAFDKMVKVVKDSRASIEKKVEEQTKDIISKSKDLEQQQAATLNILEDVEEEKEISHQLAKDLEKFKLAVEHASDHIVITDADGIILYANKAAEKITGFSNKEIIAKKAGNKELWGGLMEQKFYQQLWKTIKVDKSPFIGFISNKRKNGEKYEAEAHISPVVDKQGEVKFFVGIERDVSKEKQIDRAKTEFVSLASHQLRTPLSAINWYAEMLLNGDAGKLKSEQLEYVKEISDGNHRMVDLVNALLNVSRIEMGTLAIDSEPTDLRELADSVLAELKPQLLQKKQKVITNYDKNLSKINLDSKIMRVVWQNFLSNAVKYTPDKGKITVGIAVKGKDALISVADTGYGIPKSQQDKIFTKLFRADNIREKVTDGTGLGLYIIKSIIEQFGGKVWFESVENKGTTFYASIPLKGVSKKEGSKGLN